jgi:hypothetical protein
MSKRDQRLAAEYAAQGKESASARNARKAAETAKESAMDGMRRALKEPRTEESRAAAKAYKLNLPPLG